MNKGIFLLLGTNLGDRQAHLATARGRIEKEAGRIVKTSSVYQTAAWGKTDEPDFLNQVIEIETTQSPAGLLAVVLAIENDMGRQRTIAWGSRIIDIDILLYGMERVDTESLTIPHRYMAQRRFTLLPLAEIAPGVVHPVHQKTIAALLAACADPLAVERWG